MPQLLPKMDAMRTCAAVVLVLASCVERASASGSEVTGTLAGLDGNNQVNSSEVAIAIVEASNDNTWDPFSVTPEFTEVTENSWPGAIGSPESGYHLHGVTYSPFGGMDNVLCPPFNDTGGMCLQPNQVKNDMEALSRVTRRVRTYSSVCVNATRQIFESARDHNMSIMAGVWVDGDEDVLQAELDRLVDLIREYGSVVADICVGNEPIFVIGLTPSVVADAITKVRERLTSEFGGVNIPIGVADVLSTWMEEEIGMDNESGLAAAGQNVSSIVEQIDWIGLNSHPYWGGFDPKLGKAADSVLGSANQLVERWGKPVIIAETGFPTAGESRSGEFGTVVPGVFELDIFVSEMELASRARNTSVYFFEPYNGDWKRRWEPYIEIDYNFGLAYCNRTMKAITLPPLGAH